MISLCNCTFDQRKSFGGCVNPVISHVGVVLETYEHNGYDDSDFYALVWDAEKGRVREIEYASTRGWTYHNTAVVDATDDVKAAALAWYRNRWLDWAIENAEYQATIPVHGSVVRSTTTRGKNKGVQGVVRWIGENGYARCPLGTDQFRYGVAVEGEEKLRYLTGDRVEVINPPAPNLDEIREHAATTTPANWRSALMMGISDRTLARL